jgi:hypothetical protein
MSYETPDFDIDARKRDGGRPIFYIDTFQLKAQSEAEGRVIFGQREMVKILVPGDRLTESVQIVNDQHRRRWPQEYAAFKANEEAPLSGIPIEELAGVSKSQIEELKFMKVRTIEDLAGLSDEQLMKVVPMNGRPLREKAQRRVDLEAGNAPMEKLAAENTQLRAMMDEMKSRMEALESAKSEPKSKPAES